MINDGKDEVVQLYLDDIIPNRFQPREVFDEKALKELAVSIREHGVIQPIIVRNVNGKYEIIAGERRYKASALAGMTRIPAIIRNLDDKESSKVALLENLQRKNLNPIEEARTYQKILEIDQMTQEELAKTMGKSQSSVANKLRLLSLPDEIQDALLKEQVSERHARALLNVDDPKKQSDLLKKVITNKMTVRALEDEINLINPKEKEDEEPEGTQYVQVPSVSSIVDSTPLTPTADLLDDKDDYGKVTIVPPIGHNMPNMNGGMNIVNYGEIDKDQLNHQNSSNTRTDYYTSTSVKPVDIKSIQANAVDIKPERKENVADLDSLLNIGAGNSNIFPSTYTSNKSTNIPLNSNDYKDERKNIDDAPEKDYFGAPNFSNLDLPKVDTIIDKNDSASAIMNQNTILSIPGNVNRVNNPNEAISKIKNLVNELSAQGINITMDEMDFGKSYQVIVKIDK